MNTSNSVGQKEQKYPARRLAPFLILISSVLPAPGSGAGGPEKFLPGDSLRLRSALESVALRRLNFFLGNPPGKGANLNQKAAVAEYLRKTPSRYGMFVSIFNTKNRALVGCMGGLFPHKNNLLDEVEHWSRIALFTDPRLLKKKREQNNNHARKTNHSRARLKVAIIITFIEKVEPIGHFMEINSIREGLLVRYRGQEELVLPGEAYTAAYAFGMIRKKLGLKTIPPTGLEYFRVHAVRFGAGKKLFQKSAPDFRGYGG